MVSKEGAASTDVGSIPGLGIGGRKYPRGDSIQASRAQSIQPDSHSSIGLAQCCLTTVIKQELVSATWALELIRVLIISYYKSIPILINFSLLEI